MKDQLLWVTGTMAKVAEDKGLPAAGAISKAHDDLDYKFGFDMVHASSTQGIKELRPSASAAADQHGFGLVPGQKVVFGYKDPDKFFTDDPRMMSGQVAALQEHAGEARVKSGSGKVSLYYGRMPRSGRMEHPDLHDWAMSSKPVRVTKEIDISGNSDDVMNRVYPEVHGGTTVDQYWEGKAKEREAREAAMPKYDPSTSVV
jgi:hypothetical protein